MKTLHSRSPMWLATGLALALTAACAFAATPPADPDPTSKGTPMEDSTVPMQSTTPYTSSNSSSTLQSDSKITVGMQSKFDSLDVNHDGYIDKQEAAADTKLKGQFDKLDANKDLKLSVTEFANAKGLAMTKDKEKDKTQDSRQ